jgi:hypothetical protein
MAPLNRTPQQRDRRFARVRRLAQSVFLGSGVVSALLVAYLASLGHRATSSTPTTTPTTSTPTTTSTTTPGGGATTTTYTAPTPTTTTTVCTSTPSGHVSCN